MKSKKNIYMVLAVSILCLILVLAGIVLSSIGKNEKADNSSTDTLQTEESQNLPTETVEVIPEKTEEELLLEKIEAGLVKKSFLTGEWVDTEISTNRPVAVMVENSTKALPHYGITNAGVVYEAPVEGGLTRLMCIFQDYKNLERIGNVRSCRVYYVYFAAEFDAVYFHAGQNMYALPALESGIVNNVSSITGKGGNFFERISEENRVSPHNLYTSAELITSAMKEYGYRETLDESYSEHYQFADDASPVILEEGQDLYAVSFYYYSGEPWYIYNERDGLYYRYVFEQPHMDGLSDTQVTAKNIIIQECERTFSDEAHEYPYIEYLAGGKGKYITNGKCIDITWSKDSDTAPTKYFDLEGNEIVLNQGKTWVQIVEAPKASQNCFYATKEEFENR